MIDNKSLEILEFPRIREILASHTSFTVSREKALNVSPSADIKQISVLLKQSAEASRIISLVPDFSIGSVTDIRESLKLSMIGKALEPATLLEIQRSLTSFRLLRSKLSKLNADIPVLWSIASQIMPLPDIEKRIASCFSNTGEVLDTASPELAEIRHRLKSSREQIVRHLDAIIKSHDYEKYLQEPLITERDGRYVIPVKIEYRREFKGIVHDISNTGATAFIEPIAAVELGNEIRELVIAEKREVERILLALSSLVAENETTISSNLALVAEIDFALAKARYAEKENGTEPQIGCADGKHPLLNLIKARHPLLKGNPVPLTVEIGKDYKVLIITGPNTGGKTVALKTIGLLTLMAQSGIPIPASGESCIPVFDGVFADIGDEQSIEQTLSTFSWHMTNIVHILKNSDDNSLVLLDELGTSTDPAEGAALAQSILLHLLSRGTITIATTHFSDLKAFAHKTPGIQNASLDFDPVTLAPTYHLTVGIPGGSNALATASRLGLPQEIIDNARERLGKGSEAVELMLADLMADKQKIEALRDSLEKEKKDADNLKRRLEEELRNVKEKERIILSEVKSRLIKEGDELQKLISDAVSELKKAKSRESVEQARKALAAMRDQINSQTWQPEREETRQGMLPGEFAIGDKVWLRELNVQGIVMSPVDEVTGQIEIQVGHTTLKLNKDSVDKAAAPVAPTISIASSRQPLKAPVSPELDLRGKRAAEVEAELDTFLNDTTVAGLSEVRIIHGYGTGAVRQVVRDILASHPLVKSFRSGMRGEGGDGATVAWLKE